MSCAAITVLEILSIITEARTADPLILLQVASDSLATGSFVYKGIREKQCEISKYTGENS